jgi:hypothetical protein
MENPMNKSDMTKEQQLLDYWAREMELKQESLAQKFEALAEDLNFLATQLRKENLTKDKHFSSINSLGVLQSEGPALDVGCADINMMHRRYWELKAVLEEQQPNT